MQGVFRARPAAEWEGRITGNGGSGQSREESVRTVRGCWTDRWRSSCPSAEGDEADKDLELRRGYDPYRARSLRMRQADIVRSEFIST